jgi:hypothetical protein
MAELPPVGAMRRTAGRGQDGAMPLRRSARWVAVSSMAVGSLLAGCSSPARGAAVPANGCAPPFNERLDPRSVVHLFPAAPEPAYLTDPPTSGPHRLGLPFRGVVASPIPRASQVAMLESGFVIIQSQGLSTGAGFSGN